VSATRAALRALSDAVASDGYALVGGWITMDLAAVQPLDAAVRDGLRNARERHFIGRYMRKGPAAR